MKLLWDWELKLYFFMEIKSFSWSKKANCNGEHYILDPELAEHLSTYLSPTDFNRIKRVQVKHIFKFFAESVSK